MASIRGSRRYDRIIKSERVGVYADIASVPTIGCCAIKVLTTRAIFPRSIVPSLVQSASLTAGELPIADTGIRKASRQITFVTYASCHALSFCREFIITMKSSIAAMDGEAIKRRAPYPLNAPRLRPSHACAALFSYPENFRKPYNYSVCSELKASNRFSIWISL